MDKQDTGLTYMAAVTMAAAIIAAMLPGCAQPVRQTPPVAGACGLPPALQMGCLLPRPEHIDTSRDGSVDLRVAVSATGMPVDASVLGRVTPTGTAFAEAARKCSFRPATRGGEPVAGTALISFRWRAGQHFIGTSRCFIPHYPDVSRRLHETGKVVVLVRLPEGAGPAELRLQPTQAPARLVSHSLDAARTCLAHDEAREGMQRGAWYAAPYEWQLDPEGEPDAKGPPTSPSP
ncbi:MAG: hypothetical protein EPO12_08240 [Aquabacterium sp.]|jgi:hypothetical protein|nr:MAG: hypothetical protein EPO12_08240 [Aquabacterium sp.]